MAQHRLTDTDLRSLAQPRTAPKLAMSYLQNAEQSLLTSYDEVCTGFFASDTGRLEST
jgi:hypothetical protein